MGVSKNRGTPKSSILIGFSIINHPFWGTTIFGKLIYSHTGCILKRHLLQHPILLKNAGDLPSWATEPPETTQVPKKKVQIFRASKVEKTNQDPSTYLVQCWALLVYTKRSGMFFPLCFFFHERHGNSTRPCPSLRSGKLLAG